MAKLKSKLDENYFFNLDISHNKLQESTFKKFEHDEVAMEDLRIRLEKERNERTKSNKKTENIIVY